jgi:uncharacterized membrane protein YhaH (DUF805 family)
MAHTDGRSDTMTRNYQQWARPSLLEWLFPSRLTRAPYAVRLFLLYLLSPLATLLAGAHSDSIRHPFLLFSYMILAAIFALKGMVFPRLRDLGWSPHFGWTALVPLIGGIMMIVIALPPGANFDVAHRTANRG